MKLDDKNLLACRQAAIAAQVVNAFLRDGDWTEWRVPVSCLPPLDGYQRFALEVVGIHTEHMAVGNVSEFFNVAWARVTGSGYFKDLATDSVVNKVHAAGSGIDGGLALPSYRQSVAPVVVDLSEDLENGDIAVLLDEPLIEGAAGFEPVLTSDQWSSLLQQRRATGRPLHLAEVH
jgi:hypothetical protein